MPNQPPTDPAMQAYRLRMELSEERPEGEELPEDRIVALLGEWLDVVATLKPLEAKREFTAFWADPGELAQDLMDPRIDLMPDVARRLMAAFARVVTQLEGRDAWYHLLIPWIFESPARRWAKRAGGSLAFGCPWDECREPLETVGFWRLALDHGFPAGTARSLIMGSRHAPLVDLLLPSVAPEADPNANKLLTRQEAADLLEVKPQTVSNWVTKGTLPADCVVKASGRPQRFHRGRLLAWDRGRRKA